MRLLAAFLAVFSVLSLIVQLNEASGWFALLSAALFAIDLLAGMVSRRSGAHNISRATVL